MRNSYIVVIAILLFATACKKTTSPFNFGTGMTATFNGSTNAYVTPSGLVNTTSNYTISGYERATTSNNIVLTIDSAYSATFPLAYNSGNSLQINNNGSIYSTTNNRGSSAGSASVTISGKNVTGSFSGTLYTSGLTDSLIVTGGTISTTY